MTRTGKTAIIDSSVLVAFFNADDDFFERAKEILSLRMAPVILFDEILHETLALLRKRVSKGVAVEAAKVFLSSAFFEMSVSTEKTINEALELFIDKTGKYSYADCIIVIESQLHKLPVLTFDKHFREFGLKIIS